MDWAVIFDCDGVLLELTRDEEETFFDALAHYGPADALSRDWNSYAVRNEEDILAEVLQRFGRPDEVRDARQRYLDLLAARLGNGTVKTVVVPGAPKMLNTLSATTLLGLATANLLDGAAKRLQLAGVWPLVEHFAAGADGGGHKHAILRRLLARLALPPERVIYVGDNLNDLVAAQENRTAFIAFSTDARRRAQLAAAGAARVAASHAQTLAHIREIRMA